MVTDWGKVISSATLLGKEKSIVILHDGQRYRLSITKLRKLILTK
jgi:hemin uptake protein HemP